MDCLVNNILEQRRRRRHSWRNWLLPCLNYYIDSQRMFKPGTLN
jgi:hypothetical protein